MEGKKKRESPRMMLLDWMKTEDYSKLKLDIVVNGAFRRTNLPRKAENQEEEGQRYKSKRTFIRP